MCVQQLKFFVLEMFIYFFTFEYALSKLQVINPQIRQSYSTRQNSVTHNSGLILMIDF
jgi:hypothetical protein